MSVVAISMKKIRARSFFFFFLPQSLRHQTTQRHFNWSKLRNSKRKSSGPKKTALFPEETMVGLTEVLKAQTLSKMQG